MKLSNTDIEFLKNFFSKKPVKKAFIFGSYSRNDANADSDLDILVELDYSKHVGLQFIQMKLEIEEALHKKADLVSEKSISKYILPFINQDKQLIYER
jgi:predicted nucleotidyltransferase